MLSSVTDSSSSSTFVEPPASILMPIQLTMDNYLLWKSMFPILNSHGMLNLAEGREQCPPQFLSSSEEEKQNEDPAYTNWIKRDQIFLTWINASLSASLLRYTRECTSGRALWLQLENLLAKDATSRVLGLKARLQNLDKRSYGKMKKYLDSAQQIADELEAAGSPVDDGEFVSHILEGLLRPPTHYEDLVQLVASSPTPVTRQRLQQLLLSHRSPIEQIKSSICFCWGLFIVPLALMFGSLYLYKIFKR
ncbi:hypothetical protein M0R45_023844 [Rubus argutus]|uniref:Retrotransposon Copia-like N-terminal domain-containing protein n=1 Tax=Rubus argutus TaxID=59490 RepID=A0AAW1WQZ3_RUBAR